MNKFLYFFNKKYLFILAGLFLVSSLALEPAVDAMRKELNKLDIRGEVVIGEGERDEAPMLYIGEKVGTGNGPEVDIALDPLEGTTLTAKGQADALTTIAMAEKGSLLNAADVYMDKIAIGPGCPDDLVHLDEDPDVNVKAYSKATKKPIEWLKMNKEFDKPLEI